MSRGLRLIPIILLLWLVIGFAWRLVKPADPAVPSQMVERSLPQFELVAAVPDKPGFKSSDLASGKPRLLNIFASWCVPCVGEAPVLEELKSRGVEIDAIAVRDTPGAIGDFLNAQPLRGLADQLESRQTPGQGLRSGGRSRFLDPARHRPNIATP